MATKTKLKEFTVYFEGKITVEAETEDLATDEAYSELNANTPISFQITSVEDNGEVEE